MLDDERPSNVFNAANVLFIELYELTSLGREIITMDTAVLACRWRLGSSLRTTLELPTLQLYMDELLRKVDILYVTVPPATVSTISEVRDETASAIHANDLPVVSALFRKRGGKAALAKVAGVT